MNLRHLSDESLRSECKEKAYNDRESTTILLHHIKEVDRRRLYAKWKFKDLKDYVVRELKFSEPAAWRRISAMKAIKEDPRIEQKINDGAISLTTIVAARAAFSKEAKKAKEENPTKPKQRTTEEKFQVLMKLEGATQSQAQQILSAETGIEMKITESEREIQDGKLELKTVLSRGAKENVARLKGLLAHQYPNLSTAELLEMALTALREKVDPMEKSKRKARDEAKAKNADPISPVVAQRTTTYSRYIPSAIRQHVWMRDQGRCRNCGSDRAIEYEHVTPIAKGGTHDAKNIALLCRSCNQRSAIEQFGQKKMDSFLRSTYVKYH